MIEEMTASSYLGVVCCHCTGKIAVAGRSAVRYQDLKSRAFTLRCHMREQERVYGFHDVREFEGAPPVRVLRPKRTAGKVAS